MARWTDEIKQVVIVFLPGPLKPIVQNGLLVPFLALVGIVVVLPPVLVLLAAFWLRLLGGIDVKVVRALRDGYVDVVEKGFAIDEIAARSNIRLDYLQLFDYDLKPQHVREASKEMRLSLKPWQKALIIFRTITLTAEEQTCTLPEDIPDLVAVSLGDQPIRTLGPDSNITIDIGKRWWRDHADKFGDDDLVERLSFKLTDQARHLACGQVHIEGSVEVFKDLVPAS